MADSGNIKVVVRCRPMNSRGTGESGERLVQLLTVGNAEKNRGASNLIEVTGQHQLVLSPPGEGDSRENARATKKKAMPFSFDRSYGPDTEQKELFEYVGLEVLEHSFNGFNTVSTQVVSDECTAESDHCAVCLCLWANGVGQVAQHGRICRGKGVDPFDVLAAI